MKVKLLKKIRKRFDWYIDKNGVPILIDKKKKISTRINVNWCKEYLNYTDKDVAEKINVSMEEWCWRWLKTRMLQPFGYNWAEIRDKQIFNRTIRFAKKRKNWITNNKKVND